MDNTQYYTPAEMAEKLRVSIPTVRRYAALNIIGSYQPGGKGAAVRYYLLEETTGTSQEEPS